MKSEDWRRFGDWLWNFESKNLWTLEQLVTEYEKTNPAITWLKNELYD
jgi:hypothetical protein